MFFLFSHCKQLWSFPTLCNYKYILCRLLMRSTHDYEDRVRYCLTESTGRGQPISEKVFMVIRRPKLKIHYCFITYQNKNNQTISWKSYPLATANKAIHCLKWGKITGITFLKDWNIHDSKDLLILCKDDSPGKMTLVRETITSFYLRTLWWD